MRFLSIFTVVLILAIGTANVYKDNPQAPFEMGITIAWWGFGITLLYTIVMAIVWDKSEPGYGANVAQISLMPIVTLVAIGLISLMKNSIG